MANDRMWLKCVGCGERILLGKTYGDGYELFHTKAEYDKFLDEHAFCNAKNDDMLRFQDFVLKYESEESSMKPMAELLDLLPRYIAIPREHPFDEDDREIWYHFTLTKDEDGYDLSYYTGLSDDTLISFTGSLHEVAGKMYDWCKENGYIK